MKSWSSLQGTFDHYLCGSQGVDLSKLPLKKYVMHYRQPRKYPGVPEDWQKLYRIADARNILREYGENYDYGLYLDADIEVPPDLLERLIRHGKDIISPLVRVPTSVGLGWGFGYFKNPLRDGWVNKEIREPLQRVDAVCTSCMLLSNQVMNDQEVGFKPVKLREDLYAGEDHGFCYLAGKAGYEVYVDTTFEVKHWKVCWNHQKLKLELRPLGELGCPI